MVCHGSHQHIPPLCYHESHGYCLWQLMDEFPTKTSISRAFSVGFDYRRVPKNGHFVPDQRHIIITLLQTPTIAV